MIKKRSRFHSSGERVIIRKKPRIIEIEVPSDEVVAMCKGYYHPPIEFGTLKAVGMISGCGIMQLSGNASYTYGYLAQSRPAQIEKFKVALEGLKALLPPVIGPSTAHRICRTFICSLGSCYFSGFEDPMGGVKLMEEMGFKEVFEFNNASMSTKEVSRTQKLFTYVWE